jgi:hypothetical protein
MTRTATLREILPQALYDAIWSAYQGGKLTIARIHEMCEEERYAAEFEARGVLPAYAVEYVFAQLGETLPSR